MATIVRRTGKTGQALTLMQLHAKVHRLNTPLVFPNATGERPMDIRDAWELAIERAAITDFRFHDLRHSAASYLAMSGASLTRASSSLKKAWICSPSQEIPAAFRYKEDVSNFRYLRKIGSGMPIPFCSIHERLFVQQKNAWINWSQDYVTMVKHICDILDSANIVFSDYEVMESPCDLCIEIARQALQQQ